MLANEGLVEVDLPSDSFAVHNSFPTRHLNFIRSIACVLHRMSK